jgi:hypothetical protein
MASFIKPNKRGAEVETCSVDFSAYKTSPSLQIGPPQFVAHLKFRDGRSASVELNREECLKLMSKIEDMFAFARPSIPSDLGQNQWAISILNKIKEMEND